MYWLPTSLIQSLQFPDWLAQNFSPHPAPVELAHMDVHGT